MSRMTTYSVCGLCAYSVCSPCAYSVFSLCAYSVCGLCAYSVCLLRVQSVCLQGSNCFGKAIFVAIFGINYAPDVACFYITSSLIWLCWFSACCLFILGESCSLLSEKSSLQPLPVAGELEDNSLLLFDSHT